MLRFPSRQVADPLDTSQIFHALIHGKRTEFDLVREVDYEDVFLEQIICGSFMGLEIVRDGNSIAYAKVEIEFDSRTLPAGLKGGLHTLRMDDMGYITIPESMIEDVA